MRVIEENVAAPKDFILLGAGDGFHARASTPETRATSDSGDWVFTSLGEAECIAIPLDMDANNGTWSKGHTNPDWLGFVMAGLLHFAPDVGFGVVEYEGSTHVGFVMPSENEADLWISWAQDRYEQHLLSQR